MTMWKTFGIRVQTCVTSPPYFGLRDYGHSGQIGLEQTPSQYVETMVEVFRCVRDILADDGTLWLNLGDSYAAGGMGPGSGKQLTNRGTSTGGHMDKPRKAPDGFKPKDLLGIPWRVAFALQADGWYLRQDIIWHKPNPMPESVRDRCTRSHEYIFLMSKSERYYFDSDAMQEPAQSSKGASSNGSGMRNRRSVWTVATRPYKGAHFATYPAALIDPCVLAGSRHGDIVLDPFMGSGTTAAVAIRHGRQYMGCEVNPEYKTLQDERLSNANP